MKAVLSNRIFMEVTPQQNLDLKRHLTYKIATYGDAPPLIINNFSVFRKNVLSFPVGRTDLIPSEYEIVDKRVLKPVNFPEFLFELRESQQKILDDTNDNCIINAKPGWGKTFTAAALAAKFGQKTLVIVHTLALMNQWAKEIEKVFGFKPGLIGGGQENYAAPITIGNVASVSTRMEKLGKEFGFLIIDECHHTPASTFSKIADRSYARYKVGLSGTLERKDGLHVILTDYFGKTIHKPPKENTVDPIVHAYDTGIWFPFGGSWAGNVTLLNEDVRYQAFILDKIEKYTELGHEVLLVSDRTEFLKNLARVSNSALIIGETKDRDAEFNKLINKETRSLCGAISIFKEGISHNPLSCLILGTPTNNIPMLEQLCGRVQRIEQDKLQPIIVDPIIRGNVTEKQFINRTGFYMKQGWQIDYK